MHSAPPAERPCCSRTTKWLLGALGSIGAAGVVSYQYMNTWGYKAMTQVAQYFNTTAQAEFARFNNFTAWASENRTLVSFDMATWIKRLMQQEQENSTLSSAVINHRRWPGEELLPYYRTLNTSAHELFNQTIETWMPPTEAEGIEMGGWTLGWIALLAGLIYLLYQSRHQRVADAAAVVPAAPRNPNGKEYGCSACINISFLIFYCNTLSATFQTLAGKPITSPIDLNSTQLGLIFSFVAGGAINQFVPTAERLVRFTNTPNWKKEKLKPTSLVFQTALPRILGTVAGIANVSYHFTLEKLNFSSSAALGTTIGFSLLAFIFGSITQFFLADSVPYPDPEGFMTGFKKNKITYSLGVLFGITQATISNSAYIYSSQFVLSQFGLPPIRKALDTLDLLSITRNIPLLLSFLISTIGYTINAAAPRWVHLFKKGADGTLCRELRERLDDLRNFCQGPGAGNRRDYFKKFCMSLGKFLLKLSALFYILEHGFANGPFIPKIVGEDLMPLQSCTPIFIGLYLICQIVLTFEADYHGAAAPAAAAGLGVPLLGGGPSTGAPDGGSSSSDDDNTSLNNYFDVDTMRGIN